MKEKILIIGGGEATVKRVEEISKETGKEIIVMDDLSQIKKVQDAFGKQLSKMELKAMTFTEAIHEHFTNPNSRVNRRKKIKPKRVKNKRL